MEHPTIKLKKLHPKAIVPTKRQEDAGYDMYGIYEKDFVFVRPKQTIIIPTGFALEFPKDWTMIIKERGSTGYKGIGVRSGVFDSGYRGEYNLILHNVSHKPLVFSDLPQEEIILRLEDHAIMLKDVTVYPQSKAIAQGVLFYTPHCEIQVVDELSSSERGDGWRGSSQK